MRLSRFFLRAFVAGLILFIISIPAVYLLAPAGGFFFGPLLLVVPIGTLVLTWLLACFICASVHDRGLAPHLMRSGIVMATIAALGWIALIGAEIAGFRLFLTDRMLTWPMVLIWPTLWGGCCAIIGIMILIRPRAAWWMRLRTVTTTMIVVLAMLIGLTVLLETDYYTGHNLLTVWFAGHVAAVATNVLMSVQCAALLALLAIVLFLSHRPRDARAARVITCTAVLVGAAAVVIAASAPFFELGLDGQHVRDLLVSSDGEYGSPPTAFDMVLPILTVVLGTVAAIAFLATIGVALLFKVSGTPMLDDRSIVYDVICPRCAAAERAFTGEHLCSACGLRIRLDLT